MRYLDNSGPVSDGIGSEGDEWLNTSTNTLYIKQEKYWVAPWDSDECGCNHPNAHPPCGYCENGEYHTVESDLDELDKYWTQQFNPPLTERELVDGSWKDRALAAELKLSAIESENYDKLYEKVTEQIRIDETDYIMQGLREDLYHEVRLELENSIYEDEYKSIKKKLEDEILRELTDKIREELMIKMTEAISRI